MFFCKKKEIKTEHKLQEKLEEFKKQRTLLHKKITTTLETIILSEDLYNPRYLDSPSAFLDKEIIEICHKSHKNNFINKELTSYCTFNFEGMIENLRKNIDDKTLFITEKPSVKEIYEVKKKIKDLSRELIGDKTLITSMCDSNEACEINRRWFNIKKNFNDYVYEINNQLNIIINLIQNVTKEINLSKGYVLYLQRLKEVINIKH